MCGRILQQCEAVSGGREKLASILEVHPHDLAIWISGKAGPPRPVFDKAIDIILAEHDRRAAMEQAAPRRRSTDR